ncbi:hypothetical protein CBR65_13735 [Cellvibrio sp. PSBB006]|nr:hypothetical protein CBR65_13735 [Cellvibrio sp. PSBB006]
MLSAIYAFKYRFLAIKLLKKLYRGNFGNILARQRDYTVSNLFAKNTPPQAVCRAGCLNSYRDRPQASGTRGIP